MLVVGPPGSGKTVVAVFRREAASNMGVPARIAVHNRVLSRFTGLEGTFLSWFLEWWNDSTDNTRMPRISTGSRYKPVDYKEATKKLVTHHKERVLEHGNWGHLILDEAQDFNRDVHQLLNFVPAMVFCDREQSERPSLTILADDNERITGDNSTIDEIMDVHNLTNDDVYLLRKNYRNTKEIAMVARHFHVGARTGTPELPERRGDKPQLIYTSDVQEAASRIANYAKIHPDQEIGVLVQYVKTRRRFYRALENELGDSGILVQQYDSGEQGSDEALIFDRPGTVTVLCFSSSKGLEFDTVFLPELQTLRVEGEAEDFAKMTLYVMCSRARSHLVLMIDESASRQLPFWNILPPEAELGSLFEISTSVR